MQEEQKNAGIVVYFKWRENDAFEVKVTDYHK